LLPQPNAFDIDAAADDDVDLKRRKVGQRRVLRGREHMGQVGFGSLANVLAANCDVRFAS
jgi:hypothetical protein